MTIAKYLRISDEDRDIKRTGKEESDSIGNQRNLLESFIGQHEEFVGAENVEFCDDGWSGKNFERPGVRAMLEQVKQGKIQCILVKDISRFGRDYLMVGNYISKIFPFMGVRFIAVNDGIDSARPLCTDRRGMHTQEFFHRRLPESQEQTGGDPHFLRRPGEIHLP